MQNLFGRLMIWGVLVTVLLGIGWAALSRLPNPVQLAASRTERPDVTAVVARTEERLAAVVVPPADKAVPTTTSLAADVVNATAVSHPPAAISAPTDTNNTTNTTPPEANVLIPARLPAPRTPAVASGTQQSQHPGSAPLLMGTDTAVSAPTTPAIPAPIVAAPVPMITAPIGDDHGQDNDNHGDDHNNNHEEGHDN